MTRRLLLAWAATMAVMPVARARAEEKVLLEKRSAINTIIVTEDERGLRTLSFAREGARQSVAKPGDADHLELPYTRVMPVGVLLVDQPRRALMVGLGGGTIPTFLHKHWPAMAIDVVEIDGELPAVAERFFGLHPDARLQVHIEDGRQFIEKRRQPYDIVLLDAFSAEEIPFHLATREFLHAVRRTLTPEGVVVANVWGERDNALFEPMVKTYQAVFNQLYIVDIREVGNKILIALPRKTPIHQDELVQKAGEFSKRNQLEFDLGEMLRHGLRPAPSESSNGNVLTDSKRPTAAK